MITITNILSLSRIPLIFYGSYEISVGKYLYFFVIYLAIIATDIADGIIARRYNISSLKGEIIDLSSDCFATLVISFVLMKLGIYNLYIVLFEIVFIVNFVVTSYFYYKNGKNKIKDKMGIIAGRLFYGLPLIAIIVYKVFDLKIILESLFLIIILMGTISIINRINALIKLTKMNNKI